MVNKMRKRLSKWLGIFFAAFCRMRAPIVACVNVAPEICLSVFWAGGLTIICWDDVIGLLLQV